MAKDKSRGRADKNTTRKQCPVLLNDDSVLDDEIVENPDSDDNPDKVQDVSECLSGMTEEEMAQHLKLCMKLSVENKINMKNAFGLHLIGIMQEIVNKNEKADIQQASLSLQASSKIFAGRVEALYQDTYRFQGQLQSIVSGNKKEKNKKTGEAEEDMDDDNSENKKTKSQKSKCKSFLKPEESLNIEDDTSNSSTKEPHGNFVTLNSAFSTSRLAPKLLSCLQLAKDACLELNCGFPVPSFKPKNILNNTSYTIPPKMTSILEKIKNFVPRAEMEANSSSNEMTFASRMNISRPDAQSPPNFEADNDDFAAPFDVCMSSAPSDNGNLVESAIQQFDVLNLTVDAFVNDISAVVTDKGIDHALIPQNSVLKKMVERSGRRSSIKPSATKTTRQKIKEPFFAGKSTNDIKHLFVKGRTTCLSHKALSEWNIDNTSNIDLGYQFIEELGRKKEKEDATLNQVLEVIKQNDLQYHFKYYFHKQSQMWKISRRKLCLNESDHDTSFANQTEKRVGSIAPNDPEGLALSFRNLSLHDSLHEIPECGEDASFNEGPGLNDIEDAQFIASSEPFEIDVEDLMVKPPELVRPPCMKFDKRPVNLNTEKIKDLMWLIISRHLKENNSAGKEESFALFSKVYEELKIKLEREISEFISMQFAFVVLLILANQKTLLIENVKENTDLSIKQDISEIDVNKSF